MRFNIRIFAAALVLFSAIVSGAQTIDLEKERVALLQTDIEFAQASVEKGAAEAFRMYLTEDAIQLPTRANPVIGRDSVYAAMVKSSSNYILDWVPQLAEVSQAGDMGWTWGWYTTTYNDANGEQQTARGKYLNVWKKMPDGSWKVVADIGN